MFEGGKWGETGGEIGGGGGGSGGGVGGCPGEDLADDGQQTLQLFQKACSPLFTNLLHSHWWMEWSALRERVDLKVSSGSRVQGLV